MSRNTILTPAARIIASFFYVGFIPVIPGTFGSLAAFPIYYFLVLAGSRQIYLGTIVGIILLGFWAAGRAEADSKIVDPSFVVLDEVAGQLITLFLIPVSWKFWIIGFVIFRLMDIVKPFPAGQAERLPGGFGIMLDDVMAGIYSNLILQLVVFVFAKL